MEHQRRFAVDPPKRVLVFGSPGSGRARIVELLAQKFALPIFALDREKRARAFDESAWRDRLDEIAGAAAWVMVGNDLDALNGPLRRADWLILLNLPMSGCLLRVLGSAVVQRLGKAASDLEGGFWSAIREVWDFPTEIAPHVSQAIERERRNRTIFILHTKRDVARFLTRLPDADGSAQGPAQSAPSA